MTEEDSKPDSLDGNVGAGTYIQAKSGTLNLALDPKVDPKP